MGLWDTFSLVSIAFRDASQPVIDFAQFSTVLNNNNFCLIVHSFKKKVDCAMWSCIDGVKYKIEMLTGFWNIIARKLYGNLFSELFPI